MTGVTTGGACVWLTGLSGSGKTTTAVALRDAVERAGRVVTLLDGDEVRQRLVPGLGFTRADRDRNVLAVAWLAAEIVRHGGIVICSLISPYRAARAEAREIVGPGFIEVFVDAPVAVCQARDVKGLYRRTRKGEMTAMTGIDDPYEPPLDPDIRIDTVAQTVDQNVATVLRFLERRAPSGPIVAPARDRED